MSETIAQTLLEYPWLAKLVRIAAFFLLAWIVHRINDHLARPLTRMSRLAQKDGALRPERQDTLHELIASLISGLAFIVALILSLGQFVEATTLVWMVGLFSAAFGLGARPLISDYLTGIGFIFEDTFSVGEKVEIVGIEGVIESMSLRTASLRAPTGELFIVPHGEIRTIRNFSRGRFSTTRVTLKVASEDLAKALALLNALGEEAVSLLPNLLEPWQVISESGIVGEHTDLTIIAKSRFGMAAEMRPRLLTFVQENLAAAGIPLAN